MDWRFVRLFLRLNIRHFVNTAAYALTQRLSRLYILFLTFTMTWLILFLASTLGEPEPMRFASPLFLELTGLGLFLFIALTTSVVAFRCLTLKQHEEDILLTMPTEVSSIVQSRLILILYLVPFITLLITCTLLGLGSVLAGTDFIGRFPFTYLSILLFIYISTGALFVIAGIWRKYQNVTSRVETVVPILAAPLVSAAIIIILLYSPQLFQEMYFHPVTRLLLVVPLTSAHIHLFGSLSMITASQIILLTVLASALMYSAFRFKYELHESQISPYQRIIGRGAERESPPLPLIVDKIRKAFHIEYLDLGEGPKAIFGFGYSLSLRVVLLFVIFVVFFLPMLVNMGQVDSPRMFGMHFIFVMPLLIGSSWIGGAFVGSIVLSQINVDILRTIPEKGEKIVFNLIAPGLLQLGICYFIILGFSLLIFQVNPILLVAEMLIIVPVVFISAYTSMMAIVIFGGPMRTVHTPEGLTTGSPILSGLLLILPIPAIVASFFLAILTRQLAVSISAVFLLTSLSMPIAYLLYRTAANNLDALRPR